MPFCLPEKKLLRDLLAEPGSGQDDGLGEIGRIEQVEQRQPEAAVLPVPVWARPMKSVPTEQVYAFWNFSGRLEAGEVMASRRGPKGRGRKKRTTRWNWAKLTRIGESTPHRESCLRCPPTGRLDGSRCSGIVIEEVPSRQPSQHSIRA